MVCHQCSIQRRKTRIFQFFTIAAARGAALGAARLIEQRREIESTFIERFVELCAQNDKANREETMRRDCLMRVAL